MAASPLGTRPGWPGPAVLGFVACGAVVRRADFLAAGGFESRLGVGGEEELLALDLAQSGRHLVYAPEVVARHHPSPARDPERRQRVQARNALWCAWLRRPLRSALAVTLRTLRSAFRDRAVRAGLAEPCGASAGSPRGGVRWTPASSDASGCSSGGPRP
jgi:hypothetical protein